MIYGQSRTLFQAEDKIVEGRGADRIEPGGRLVEKQNIRVESERTGQSGTLAHAPGQLGGIFVAGLRRQSDQGYLHGRDLLDERLGHPTMLAYRHRDILGHRERAEERAVLKQDPASLLETPAFAERELRHFLPEDLDGPGIRPSEPDDAAQENRFARAGTADDTEHFASQHVEIETVMNRLVAESVDEPADSYDRLAGLYVGFHL